MSLARFCLAQRSFCAAAILALPSGEIGRLARKALGLGATNPLLRGPRATLVRTVPAIRSRASVKRLISASMWRIISSVIIALKCISTHALEHSGGRERMTISRPPKQVSRDRMVRSRHRQGAEGRIATRRSQRGLRECVLLRSRARYGPVTCARLRPRAGRPCHGEQIRTPLPSH